jgi:hypothetical protein
MSCNMPTTGGRRGGQQAPEMPQPAAPAMGSARRRKGSKKSRRMRGGMGYGFGGTIGTAGPVWDSSWGGEITKSGTPIYDTADRPPVVGGRRRKSKKGSKKSRRARRRTMRGGMSIAHASAGFTGTGERGLANYQDVGSSQPFSNDVVRLS